MRALKTKGVGHVHQLLFNNYASNPTIFAKRKSCESKALSSDTDQKNTKQLLKPEPGLFGNSWMEPQLPSVGAKRVPLRVTLVNAGYAG